MQGATLNVTIWSADAVFVNNLILRIRKAAL